MLPDCPEYGHAFDHQRRYSLKDLGPTALTAFRFLLVSMAGLLWSEVAGSFYPPFLATTVILFTPGVLVFISLVIFVVLLDRRREERRAQLLRNISVAVATATILIAVFLNLNGALDKNPYEEVETHVVRKVTSDQEYRSAWYAVVHATSGQNENEIYVNVSSYKYSLLESGDTIHVKVHPGWFSLPWYELNLHEL